MSDVGAKQHLLHHCRSISSLNSNLKLFTSLHKSLVKSEHLCYNSTVKPLPVQNSQSVMLPFGYSCIPYSWAGFHQDGFPTSTTLLSNGIRSDSFFFLKRILITPLLLV